MNTLRRMCALAILSLAITVSVFAGQIDSPGVAAPPPPTTSPTSIITTTLIVTIVSLIR